MQLPALIPGTLIRRYKRFLADIELDGGEIVTAHCANSGSMLGLATPGSRVHLSHSPDPKRKLAYSFELIEAHGGLVNVNTARANGVAAEAIAAGTLPAFAGYATLRREVAYGVNSRVDILLEDPEKGRAYVEVKSVTLGRRPGLAEFPDAVTARGAKHLAELSDMVAEGHRAAMLFVVQVPESTGFSLAADIDPTYARAFAAARAAGVEAIAALATVTPEAITVTGTIAII
ncbi:MAG: DNA/RNA nuclease SfsA [Ancalomicrobiaceae bacterium]|nr:DNA/RNA nuclease SfsA [Ancalomicrobiaceae bacterium]